MQVHETKSKEAFTYLDHDASDVFVVKFVNSILEEAINKGASDIHFEPFETQYRIRYRQDGLLQEVASAPLQWSARITARLKIMANLDISERRIPQDGRFDMKSTKACSIEFRVSTCPTTYGEKVVLRLLDQTITQLDLETLGFTATQHQQFLDAIKKPQGLILVTGPTGSGKTATLYTALNILNTAEVNISTAEDPVEIKVPGINQVQINPKVGLTFSTVLRAFLRQDPDILMVGEIRDLETADIAIKASQTGHLVFSTLHTNNAAQTLERLVNMSIAPFNIASALSLVVAQRLVRKLCDKCKLLSTALTPGFTPHSPIYKAQGCMHCTNGYKGQIGLFELLPMTQELSQLIMSGTNALSITEFSKNKGLVTLFQSGLEKIKLGITSLEEVKRVTVEY